jgi:hypothetical protein
MVWYGTAGRGKAVMVWCGGAWQGGQGSVGGRQGGQVRLVGGARRSFGSGGTAGKAVRVWCGGAWQGTAVKVRLGMATQGEAV